MTKMVEDEGRRASREAAKKALERTCLFQHVKRTTLERLSQSMEEIKFVPGQRLGPGQGEPQDALYVVTEGTVQRERSALNSMRKIVDESAKGMGDSPNFNVEVKPDADGGATVVVRGPDVDGLLGAVSRSLYAARLSVVQGMIQDDGEHVKDVFTVKLRDGAAIDARAAARISAAVREACTQSSLGAIRIKGVNSFGTLHCVGRLPAFATTSAVTHGTVWRLPQSALVAAMAEPSIAPDFGIDVAAGLCAEIFRMSESYTPTPLFEQPAKKVNVAAVSVAAAFESYYRAMLNSVLNANLVGSKAPLTLFPNMHIQIPTRVAYINGFKYLRGALEDLIEPYDHLSADANSAQYHTALRLVPALLPGVLMTPVSSVLEACNAEHANPEPLLRRAARGAFPRCGREIIFGLGLNNLADFCEESVPHELATSKFARNAIGSMVAGVCAGYFSHVPHNLSTLKLMSPHVSYAEHVKSLITHARQHRLPPALPEAQARFLATALTFLLPAGLGIRTTQIVGSFCLINGIAHYLA